MQPLLEIKDLRKEFILKKRNHIVLDQINLTIFPGKTLGLVGESGCGKSTLAKIILRLEEATSGQILFEGTDLLSLKALEMKKMRRKIQMIFQDPFSSLNPRMRIEQIIGESLEIHRLVSNRKEKRERIEQLLEWVGLNSSHLARYPHELSGGQRQRIAIARALAVEPKLLICDEPVSALDLTIQSQIVELFQDLQQKLNLTLLFISHDLSIVRQMSDEIAVIYLGNVIERAVPAEIFHFPQHPYTKALLSAVPIPDPILERKRVRFIMEGEPPSPYSIPSGCPLHKRCPFAMPVCAEIAPKLEDRQSKQHYVACHNKSLI